MGLSALAANPYQFPMDTKPRGRGRGGRGGKKGGARASFSAEGPVHDRSKSTIVVENIPEENFNEDEVRAFFSQFGEIVEVSMQPYKHLAVVKYDKWASANAAYRSPKVIFDNRFVKVFWHKDDGAKSSSKHGDGGSSKINGDKSSAPVEAEPEIDMEEFQRRQEEAQKQHQDRETKRVELEESERLKARLAEKSGDAKVTGSSSSTDLLRAQLAALEQEAMILGIDPEMAEYGGSYSSRGRGYMGRGGRGSDRGFAPRGRGSFRGQVGRHAAYAQYSLDNRPRKLAVTGVDFTPPDKDEMLRHFLLVSISECILQKYLSVY
jgi:RNA-binding protein 26